MAGNKSIRSQRTIERPFEFEGPGLHTGKVAHVRVSPLPAGSGLRFFRSDLKAEIPLSPNHVSGTARGTALTGDKSAVIYTVEHFLASLQGLEIDNLKIEMDSEEMPILDGSAVKFCEMLRGAGILDQGIPVSPLRVTEAFELRFGDVYLKAEPAEGLWLEVEVSFPAAGLELQKRSFRLEPGLFEAELAPARTFCLEEEIEQLRAQGLIKGGNLDCALVIGKKGVLNGPYRFDDEIVRHKTLDLLGDLTLLNRPLWAKITVKKAGHRTHVELAKAILARFGGSQKKTAPKAVREVPLLNILDIQKILPHRYPFLLVDKILELEPDKRVVGVKNVTINEPFFQGHFPGHPIMPGVLIIEAMAQVGGMALLPPGDGSGGKILYLAGIDQARFRRPVGPGDQIRFEVEVAFRRSKIAKVIGKAFVDGQIAVEAEITCAIVDKDEMKKEE
jgi:UDP-3-O-[3-hydroxymyristoyl] N-acetylglucosamine deacetylase/3-hydroxyacyl-[acyl-carrier-protein] dehydratase